MIENEDSTVRKPLIAMVDAVADRAGAVTRGQMPEHVTERGTGFFGEAGLTSDGFPG